ncbi:MAG: phosphate signaling complex protein PhoU [Anaerolineae bacterium]|nr:phosphate signaling complex protein PhoU [Anaerolineae bacterium]
MIRETFERDLRNLQDEILVLGSMVEDAIARSVQVLKDQDLAAASQLIRDDAKLNRMRFKIEEDAMILIATQQPMASDLRLLAAVIVIATELERIGDYAKGIAKITLMIGNETLLKPLIDVPRMADIARDMLHQALEAFVTQNVDMARRIPEADEEIDALYNQVYRELLTYILATPRFTEQANHLLWVAHNLERSADRVINICERIVFTVTGEMEEMDVKEGEDLKLEGVT